MSTSTQDLVDTLHSNFATQLFPNPKDGNRASLLGFTVKNLKNIDNSVEAFTNLLISSKDNECSSTGTGGPCWVIVKIDEQNFGLIKWTPVKFIAKASKIIDGKRVNEIKEWLTKSDGLNSKVQVNFEKQCTFPEELIEFVETLFMEKKKRDAKIYATLDTDSIQTPTRKTTSSDITVTPNGFQRLQHLETPTTTQKQQSSNTLASASSDTESTVTVASNLSQNTKTESLESAFQNSFACQLVWTRGITGIGSTSNSSISLGKVWPSAIVDDIGLQNDLLLKQTADAQLVFLQNIYEMLIKAESSKESQPCWILFRLDGGVKKFGLLKWTPLSQITRGAKIIDTKNINFIRTRVEKSTMTVSKQQAVSANVVLEKQCSDIHELEKFLFEEVVEILRVNDIKRAKEQEQGNGGESAIPMQSAMNSMNNDSPNMDLERDVSIDETPKSTRPKYDSKPLIDLEDILEESFATQLVYCAKKEQDYVKEFQGLCGMGKKLENIGLGRVVEAGTEEILGDASPLSSLLTYLKSDPIGNSNPCWFLFRLDIDYQHFALLKYTPVKCIAKSSRIIDTKSLTSIRNALSNSNQATFGVVLSKIVIDQQCTFENELEEFFGKIREYVKKYEQEREDLINHDAYGITTSSNTCLGNILVDNYEQNQYDQRAPKSLRQKWREDMKKKNISSNLSNDSSTIDSSDSASAIRAKNAQQKMNSGKSNLIVSSLMPSPGENGGLIMSGWKSSNSNNTATAPVVTFQKSESFLSQPETEDIGELNLPLKQDDQRDDENDHNEDSKIEVSPISSNNSSTCLRSCTSPLSSANSNRRVSFRADNDEYDFSLENDTDSDDELVSDGNNGGNDESDEADHEGGSIVEVGIIKETYANEVEKKDDDDQEVTKPEMNGELKLNNKCHNFNFLESDSDDDHDHAAESRVLNKSEKSSESVASNSNCNNIRGRSQSRSTSRSSRNRTPTPARRIDIDNEDLELTSEEEEEEDDDRSQTADTSGGINKEDSVETVEDSVNEAESEENLNDVEDEENELANEEVEDEVAEDNAADDDDQVVDNNESEEVDVNDGAGQDEVDVLEDAGNNEVEEAENNEVEEEELQNDEAEEEEEIVHQEHFADVVDDYTRFQTCEEN